MAPHRSVDVDVAVVKPLYQSRNSIEDVYGPRKGYKHQWPDREDSLLIEEPDKWYQSACIMCSNGCGCDIGVKDGRIVGVKGRVTDRVNKGRLGPKGLNAWRSSQSKDRLKYPQIRKNGILERATWDEAMDLIVRKAKETREKLTAHGIGFYTSGQLLLEEYYALAMVGKAGLCTLHMDGNTRLCTATAAASMRENFGSDGQPGSYTDIDYTDCIMLVGHNMSATQTVLWTRILDRLAGPSPPKLIVIDPRKSGCAHKASLHLAPHIGTNLALLNGIQHLLFKNDWINHDFLGKHVIGLEQLRETVKLQTPAKVEQITGVPSADIEEAARIIGTSEMLLSTCLQGVYQSNQGTASACAVNNINLITGKIGKPGSGILQMNGQPTAQNNREAGCDGEFPGFRNYDIINHMQELADVWNIELEKLPHWNQPTHIENMLAYIAAGSMQMFWISGTNPLVSLPNLPRVRKLLSKQDLFVIAQDIFPNETTAIADVVLPASAWGEKTGCFTNVDRTVHLTHKAVEPPGEAKSDLDIFVMFSNLMEFKTKTGEPLIPWNTPEDGFRAFGRLTHGRPCDYSGLTYEKLTGGSGIQWPCTEAYPNGKERLFDDGIFFTDAEYCESFGHDLETGAPISKDEYLQMNPAGKAILKACHYIPSPESVNEEFPLRLSTGRNKFHFHTRTKTGRCKPLQDAAPEPHVRISADDAEKAGIKQGDQVIVKSRRGQVQLQADVGDISRGQVFIPFHFGYFDSKDGKARAANELTMDIWDAVSKQPQFKGGAVSVTLCEDPTGGRLEVEEEQTTTVESIEETKMHAGADQDTSQRLQHIHLWLGATEESIRLFAKACDDILSTLLTDPELHAGIKILNRIALGAVDTLTPFCNKYNADKEYGRLITKHLSHTLFAPDGTFPTSISDTYRTLTTLQGLNIYLSNTTGHLAALVPASQALWDKEFTAAVQSCMKDVQRCVKWVSMEVGVRAPQTLVVPGRVVERKRQGEGEEGE